MAIAYSCLQPDSAMAMNSMMPADVDAIGRARLLLTIVTRLADQDFMTVLMSTMTMTGIVTVGITMTAILDRLYVLYAGKITKI